MKLSGFRGVQHDIQPTPLRVSWLIASFNFKGEIDVFKVYYIENGVTKFHGSYKSRKVAENRVRTLSDLPGIEKVWIDT